MRFIKGILSNTITMNTTAMKCFLFALILLPFFAAAQSKNNDWENTAYFELKKEKLEKIKQLTLFRN